MSISHNPIVELKFGKMPKKKTGQRKKAEKQKLRQKEIRTAKDNVNVAQHPCNAVMECEKCNRLVPG